MKPVCRNSLNNDYTARDAVEDLQLAIQGATQQRTRP